MNTIMKMTGFLLLTVILTLTVNSYRQAVNGHDTQQKKLDQSYAQLIEVRREIAQKKAQAAKELEARNKAAEAKKRAERALSVAQSKPPSTSASYSGSCRDAIKQAFPPALQAGAAIVLEHENRAEDPNAVGGPNTDGSYDHGCFQINNKAHPAFFASQDWRDPVANARYAYTIYQGRGNWTAWYAVQGVLW